MLLINGSNREKNSYKVLNDIKESNDELISLANKDIKFCLGCDSCKEKLEKYCVLNDYISNEVYDKIINNNKIILASPLYMSNITGLLKTMIDRLYPFYQHNLLKSKKIYLVLTGGGTYDDNEEEINSIIDYFKGISEWLYFDFEFLYYFTEKDIIKSHDNYYKTIEKIKNTIKD